MKKCTVAIAGLGSRGFQAYAPCAERFPDKMEIAAVADIIPSRVEEAAARYHIPPERCFSSAEEMLRQERLADIMFICTQDRQHVSHAIPALKKGYHLLLEKPISPELEECREILRAATEYNRKVVVCHVLRYTPFFEKIKRLIMEGVIGEVVSMDHIENVQYWHQAHSYVRGNWRRDDETSPMILAKCCHDTDMMLWLSGKKCKSVSSYGSCYLFREEKAPKGAALRCLDGCKAKADCPYDAEKIYVTNQRTGIIHGNNGWPCNILADHPTEERIYQALREGPYGRCVYHCDNNVVDHQVVNMEMEDGSTLHLTMSAFNTRWGRDVTIMGTKGEIIGHMEENTITVMPFGGKKEVIDVWKLADDFSGHGGGDHRMVEELLDMVANDAPMTFQTTSLEDSMESHFVALAAELSRKEGGRPVDLEEIRNRRK